MALSANGIFIALGANLPSRVGLPRDTIEAALGEIAARNIAVEHRSRLYQSPAWPDPADPPYVNAVARVRTDLTPGELLAILHGTETAFGRTRSVRNAPRALDLDVIDFLGRVEPGPPTLPHPRMTDRAFVLVPLAEIAPAWRHPASGLTIRALLDARPRLERDQVRALTD